LKHFLVIPAGGNLVIVLHWPMDNALDGVATVVDEDNCGREVVANDSTQLLQRPSQFEGLPKFQGVDVVKTLMKTG
jgi:hypothetical protein